MRNSSTKKIKIGVLLLFVALSPIFSIAGEIEIPSSVKTKFATLYPTADSVKWYGAKHQYWAYFKIEGKFNEIYFDEKADVMMIATTVNASELPKPIQHLAVSDSTIKIDGAGRLIDAKSDTSYQIKGEARTRIRRGYKWRAFNKNYNTKGKLTSEGRCLYTRFPYFYRIERKKKK